MDAARASGVERMVTHRVRGAPEPVGFALPAAGKGMGTSDERDCFPLFACDRRTPGSGRDRLRLVEHDQLGDARRSAGAF